MAAQLGHGDSTDTVTQLPPKAEGWLSDSCLYGSRLAVELLLLDELHLFGTGALTGSSLQAVSLGAPTGYQH